jgi:hypothetical protein
MIRYYSTTVNCVMFGVQQAIDITTPKYDYEVVQLEVVPDKINLNNEPDLLITMKVNVPDIDSWADSLETKTVTFDIIEVFDIKDPHYNYTSSYDENTVDTIGAVSYNGISYIIQRNMSNKEALRDRLIKIKANED